MGSAKESKRYPNGGELPFVLKSVTWTKPGVIEIQISKTGLIQDLKGMQSAAPKPQSFTPWQAVFDGSSYKVTGIACEVIWKFIYGAEIEAAKGDRSPNGMHSEEWSMSSVFRDEELILHPNINDIMQKYKGYVQGGRVYFNRYIFIEDPEDANKTKRVKNPFYGTRAYFTPSVELSVEKYKETTAKLDFGDFDGVGYSKYDQEVQTPTAWPGGGVTGFAFLDTLKPKNAKNYTWLLVSKKTRKSAIDCVRGWTWRCDLKGWLGQLYDDDFVFVEPFAIKD